jgi:DNA-binding MurR/RpiR family transcriptional regulator
MMHYDEVQAKGHTLELIDLSHLWIGSSTGREGKSWLHCKNDLRSRRSNTIAFTDSSTLHVLTA